MPGRAFNLSFVIRPQKGAGEKPRHRGSRAWGGLKKFGVVGQVECNSHRLARRSRASGWWVEAATVIRRCPFFVHSANEPSPIPNLRAPMGGLHVEHLRRVLARFIVRSKININAGSEPILAVAQIDSIGPGRNDARLPHATRPSDNMISIRQTAAFGLLVEHASTSSA